MSKAGLSEVLGKVETKGNFDEGSQRSPPKSQHTLLNHCTTTKSDNIETMFLKFVDDDFIPFVGLQVRALGVDLVTGREVALVDFPLLVGARVARRHR